MAAVALSELLSVSLPTTELIDDEDFGAVPLWLEMLCVFAFTMGFMLWRVFRDKKSEKKGKNVDSKLAKSIEAKLSAGDSQAAVKTWRAQQESAASSPDALKLAVQALSDVCPDSVVEEIIEHMMKFQSSSTPMATVSVLDAAARLGKAKILLDFVEAFEERMHVKLTVQMNEIILGGYAFSANEELLAAHMARMKKDNEELTMRAHSLVLRGLLRNRKPDMALAQSKDMVAAGFSMPGFATAEVVKVFCEAGRHSEVLEAMLPEVSLNGEAACIILDHCLKANDLPTALRTKATLDKTKDQLGVRGFDALVKLLASAADHRALDVFNEMQQLKLTISEGFCVGLLARSADSKFLRFAEVVVKYTRKELKMSIALYSALMKVYAYSGMYDKACDLYDQILEEGLEPDQMMYNCLMKFSASCGRMELSQRLAQKIPSLDIQNCMSLIRAAGRNKDVGMACKVLEKMKVMGQVPDTAAYNCALDVCAVAADAKTARQILDEMKELKAYPDMISYNTVLKCLAVKKDVAGARRTLAEMETAGFPPNDISYNVIINISVSAGSLREAWETVDMMTSKGIKADQYTISTMMKAVKKTNSHGDVQRVFALMDRSGIDILSDEVLLNTVLETSVRYNERRRLEAIIASYGQSKLRPAMHTYGMLIRACSAIQQVGRCRDLWTEMVQHRTLEPNELVLGCMLNALVSNGCVDEALQLLRQWKTVLKPNAVMYSTLLKGFTSSAGAGKAMELFEEMRADKVIMNASLYNSLIDVHARHGAIDQVMRLQETMKADGCPPDDLTTSLIVKAYCTTGNLKMAFKVFDEMSSNRAGAGDTVIFNTLLDGCIRANDFESADYLVEKLEAYRIYPTNFTLGIIVKMWGRRRQLDKAFAAVETMTRQYNFYVNSPVQTCLMCACLLNDNIDEALLVFGQLKASGGGADSKAYGNLISGAARLRRVDVAVQLTEEAFGLTNSHVGFQPKEMDTAVLGQLVRTLGKEGKIESVGMPLFRKLRDRGLPVGSHIASMMHGGPQGGGKKW